MTTSAGMSILKNCLQTGTPSTVVNYTDASIFLTYCHRNDWLLKAVLRKRQPKRNEKLHFWTAPFKENRA